MRNPAKDKKNVSIIVSFDVFDTLITRNTVESKDIFLLMQKNISSKKEYLKFSQFLQNNFAEIRYNTECFVRENLRINKKKREITLNDIYDCIQLNFNLSDEQVDILKTIELQTEKENLVPISQNIERLKQYVENGIKVILISDMYFSENVVRNFLVRFDSIFDKIEIYISSDYNLKKSDGSIYKYIKEQLKPKTWLHIGDNLKSDFLIPIINGIKVKRYKPIQLKKYENYILSKSGNNINIKLSIGCGKNLRLLHENKKYQFGCSFAGPILYNYVKWVLEQCLSRKINHLYFVARDGYILQKIADIIIKNENLDLITHYFYISRLACKNIQQSNKENLLELYLNQQINLSEECIAFIDINGSGKTQDYVTEILNKNRNCKTYNFYLHNKTTVKQNDLSKKIFMIPMVDTQDWIEILCRCPQGQTIGFLENTEGIVIPEKEQINSKTLIDWGIEDYMNGIYDYTKAVMKIEKQNNINISNIDQFLILNDYIHKFLDKETADIIGSIPFATSGKEKNIKEVAPKINFINLLFPKYNDYISISRCNKFIKPLMMIFRSFINIRTYLYINKDKKLAYVKLGKFKINIDKIIWNIKKDGDYND